MLNYITKRPRAALTTALAVLALVAGGVWFVYNLPDPLVAMLIDRTMQPNRYADLLGPDGLHVITTGTGAPLPDPNRAGPQTIVVAGDQVLAFDSGPGSTHKLEQIMESDAVDALFMTHYHSDHIGDMGELMLKRWTTNGRAEPLPVYGPPGIEEVVAGFNAAYRLDVGYRHEHHGEEAMPLSGAGGEAMMFDLGADLMASAVVYEQGEVQVIAFNVDHAPIYPAVGYRVNYRDRSVVITGDTVYTDSLIDHTQGADLLVSEALDHDMSTMVANAGRDDDNNVSAVAIDIQDYHITPGEAGIVAREAGVSMLLITHVLPPVPADILVRPFLADARAEYDGDVVMAHDGTLVSIDVDSGTIRHQELLR